MKRQISVALLLAICAMFITACASSGPTYHDVKASITPKPGKGLVLVFWKPATGVPKFHVYANGQLLTDRLGLGDFYAYDAPPGPLCLSSTSGSGNLTQDILLSGPLTIGLTRKKDMPMFDVRPMETYYVEMSTTGWREKLTVISKEDGEKKIEGCRWINAPGNGEKPQR